MADGELRALGIVVGVGAAAGAVVLLVRVKKTAGVGSPREAPTIRPPLPVPPPAPPVVRPAPPPEPGGSLYGAGGSIDPDHPPISWLALVTALILKEYPRIDPRIAMKWLAMESDGAPCAYGKPGDIFDGQPREIGLGQIYNPDDFKSLGLTARGITPSTFRAYCAPNTQHRTRALTSQEMEDLVRYTLLALIDHSMDVADRAVVKHGLSHWSRADYWKLVKASHAWPPILNTGLPTVVKKLGRAPRDWAEFRQILGMDEMVKDESPRSKTYGQMIPKHPTWHQGLNNAEKLASAVADVGVV